MPNEWTGVLVGKMHNNDISQVALAKHLGVTKVYVSMVLSGARQPKGAQERFEDAVEKIISESQEAS
jgi:predicted transcriptional regulator